MEARSIKFTKAKVAQSIDLGVDDPPRTSDLLEENDDLVQASGPQISLLETAPLPLQPWYLSRSSYFDKAIRDISVHRP